VTHWHPVLVHLPLGLWASVPVLLTLALYVSKARAAQFAIAASINLILGSLGALLALGSGLAAIDALPPPGPALHNVMRHVGWSVTASFLFLMLTLVRVAGRPLDAPAGRPFVAGTWIALAALILAGYYGARNVYIYRMAVAPAVSAVPVAPGQPLASARPNPRTHLR
jgi:uncharacterized membrane protein